MQNRKFLFSIVIANYNMGNFLENAINSVLTQSFKDYELIVVDAGSNDNSIDIIHKYKSSLSWWISEKDNGQSDAFNKGFSKANGQYYFWLNADDILLPKSLENANEAILKNPNGLWFAANTIFFNIDKTIVKCSVGPKWNSFLIKHNPIYVFGPTSIFHHSLYEKAGGFDETLHYTMDGDMWYRFYNLGVKFIRINSFFWGFRIHYASKTSHAYKSNPNNKFELERHLVLSKNNHKNLKLYYYLLLLYKILTLSLLKSLYYTILLRGKRID